MLIPIHHGVIARGSTSISPIVELGQFTSDASGGQWLPNLRAASQTPDSNIFGFSSMQLAAFGYNNASFTVTRNYATGPEGVSTSAARAVGATGSARKLYLGNNTGAKTYPAGTYTIAIDVKANDGTTQTVKVGCDNSGVGTFGSSASVTNAAWVTITSTITKASAAPIIPVIYCASGDPSADFLFDNVRIYSGASAPSYTTERATYAGHMVPDMRKSSTLVFSGGFLDNSSNVKPGFIKLANYPAKTSFSEGTLIAAIDTSQVNTDSAKAIGISGANGTWDVAIKNGKAYGTPALGLNSTNNGTYIAGHGTQILAVTFKSTECSFYLNGAMIATQTGSFGPFSANHFGFLGDPMPDNGNTSSYCVSPIVGKIANARIYDQFLTDSQMIQAVNEVQSHLVTNTSAPVQTQNYWIAEGDSLTTGYGSALDSYWDTYFASHPTGWMGVNMAVIGNTLTDLNGRLSTLQRRIATAAGCGHNVIVSVWVGANAVPTISDLQTYWDALRSAGAKVIACTLTPSNKVSLPTFETDRLALNTQIRAASSHYDALADFGADPNIGVRVDSTAGNPPNATYYQDYVHLNATGYSVVSSIMDVAVASLAV